MNCLKRTDGRVRRWTKGIRQARRAAAPVVEMLETRQLLSVNVTTWHNDLTRQGLNANEVALTPGNVNSSEFGRLFSYNVQGQVYAQPLYVSNLSMPGQGTHNVVFAVTQNNDVYALNADSNAGANAGVLWHINLGPAAAMPNSFFGNRYGPYHDITPQVGITSTPVIDLASDTMYIDSFTNDVPAQNVYSHHIWALDITTGQQKLAPKLVTAAVPGNGAGSSGGTINFTATQQLQRPALTLLNGTLYVAYSGYADTDPYNGWVLGFDAANLQLKSVFNTTPNAGTDSHEGEGGIWQTGNGLSSDGTNLYVMTGNGDFQVNIGDYGDSFLKLTPAGSGSTTLNGYGLSLTDYFTPYNEQSLSNADTDLGSGGTMLLPDQSGAHPHLLIGCGKQGVIYVLDRDNLGQFNANTDNVVQKVNLGHGTWNNPAYFNNTIYYHANGDVLKAFSVTNGVVSSAPVAQGSANYGYPGATPSVSSNGTANGIVWDVQYSASNAVLRAYDATTLGELYNSNQNTARDQMGAGVKFITPTIADGKVFVGTDGALQIFGLLAPPTAPPAAPTNLAAAPAGAFQIQLTWTDNANNEGGFAIERSTDGTNFQPIDVASVDATSYIDTDVVAGTTYTYRVRATNIIGDSAYTAPASATAQAASAPVYLYHFDEGVGTTTADSAGNNDGTLVGTTKPAWVSGRIGSSALNFNGDGVFKSTTAQSAVQTSIDLSTILGGTATLTAWIKTTQTGTDTIYSAPAITGVERSGSATDIRWGYLDGSGHIGAGAGNTGIVSGSAVNDGQWHNVAFTRDAGSGLIQVFVDGVLQASGASETGLETTAFRLIGAQSDVASDGVTSSGNTYLNGQLDDVRIYNEVLSPAEIASIGAIPAAPTELSATALSGSMVQLAWTNGTNLAENVEVQRKDGAGGTYQQVATLAGDATGYVDTNLSPGTHYYYRVRAMGLAGPSAFSNEADVTPPRPEVVAHYTFYNRSSFDGQNGSSNIADGFAIATDKQALLPGKTATFANYTSYSKGLNGIIIDVAGFEGVISQDDLTLMVGNSSDTGMWQPAPDPSSVAMYPGWGDGGSTRIEILWDDYAIENEWLQVTLKADNVTSLAAPDVFYFGNSVGETGNSSGDTFVNGFDFAGARDNAQPAGITDANDINRDKVVDGGDMAIIRDSANNFLNALQLITPGGGTPAPAGGSSVGFGPVISVGHVQLLANTPGQAVPIYVSGVDAVTGLSLAAQIGDGTGAGAEPTVTSVDFAGGIWDALPFTVMGGPVGGAPMDTQASVVFTNAGDSVTADGLLLTLIVDTTGLPAGASYPLMLSGSEIGQDTAFVLAGGNPLGAATTNGTIELVDPAEPLVIDGSVAIGLTPDGAMQFTQNGVSTTRAAGSFSAVQINGTAGDDEVSVDFSGGNPFGSAPVNVSGQLGVDRIALIGPDSGGNVSIGGGQVGTSGADIHFDGIETLSLHLGTGDDTVEIAGPAGAEITLDGGGGSDVVRVVSGSQTLTSDLGTGGPVSLEVAGGASAIIATSQHLSNLTIEADATALLGGAGVVVQTGRLSIGGSGATLGTLDLADGSLVVGYSGTAPYAEVSGLVSDGVASGRGIVTSMGGPAAVGLVDNALIAQTNWDGESISDGVDFHQLILTGTWAGDANLDRQVTQSDFVSVLANMGQSGATYFGGDLNLDGTVTPDDLALVLANLGSGVPAAAPVVQAAATEPPAAVEVSVVSPLTASQAPVLEAQAKPVTAPLVREHTAIKAAEQMKHRRRRLILAMLAEKAGRLF